MRKAAAWAFLGLAGAGAAGGAWWFTRPPEEPPARTFFRVELPKWVIDRSGAGLSVHGAGERLIGAAASWPGVQEAARVLDGAWPDRAGTKKAAAALNRAARAAGLDYWVDVQTAWEKPVVLSYEILERARWTLGERSVELLRVRRLDTINVEMGLLGHAGGDQPVVLMDRLEAQLSDELPEAYDEKARGNEIDRAARKLWRGLVGSRAGDGALQRAAEGLARREELFKVMETRLRGGSVRVPKPERLLYGAEFFDALKPYTDSGRRGGPLLLPGDLRDLRRADEALREGDARAALEAALDLEAHVTEAHEARHALDPEPLPMPDALLDFVGEDDLDFAASAERELRAYIGEIHDAAAPACLSVQKIARTAGGARARRTPHFFAGHVLLRALFFAGLPKDAGPAAGAALPGGGEPKEPELLEVLCALPDDVLRARAAAAYRRFYERPFVGAVRAKERTSP